MRTSVICVYRMFKTRHVTLFGGIVKHAGLSGSGIRLKRVCISYSMVFFCILNVLFVGQKVIVADAWDLNSCFWLNGICILSSWLGDGWNPLSGIKCFVDWATSNSQPHNLPEKLVQCIDLIGIEAHSFPDRPQGSVRHTKYLSLWSLMLRVGNTFHCSQPADIR